MLCAAYIAGFVLATPNGFSLVYVGSQAELLSLTEASEILETSTTIKAGMPIRPRVVQIKGKTRCLDDTRFASFADHPTSVDVGETPR